MRDRETYYNALIERYQDRICRLCCYYSHNEEDRRDLLHDINIRIWNGLDLITEMKMDIGNE